MRWKKFGMHLLYPPIALLLIILPISTVFLVYSMAFMGDDSPVSIASYVLAAYTLTVWCFRIPWLIRWARDFRQKNKYAKRWLEDAAIRVKVSLYGSLLLNVTYAAFQLGLGFYHASFWFYSMACYYALLAVMRLFLVCHTRKYRPGEQMREELLKYRASGIIFLCMNLALSLMVFFMVYWGRSFSHHEITTIAMAAYTFTSLTLAIINMVKYRKYNSPVYSATKAISLAAASVSMLTLESTMLSVFGGETMTPHARKLFLGISGGAVSFLIVAMAIYMIVQGSVKLKRLNTVKEQ